MVPCSPRLQTAETNSPVPPHGNHGSMRESEGSTRAGKIRTKQWVDGCPSSSRRSRTTGGWDDEPLRGRTEGRRRIDGGSDGLRHLELSTGHPDVRAGGNGLADAGAAPPQWASMTSRNGRLVGRDGARGGGRRPGADGAATDPRRADLSRPRPRGWRPAAADGDGADGADGWRRGGGGTAEVEVEQSRDGGRGRRADGARAVADGGARTGAATADFPSNGCCCCSGRGSHRCCCDDDSTRKRKWVWGWRCRPQEQDEAPRGSAAG